jgi:hypothetical protein
VAGIGLFLTGAGQVFAHSIDYVAMNISPPASFVGGSGNFTVIDPVAGGDTIQFDLTFSIVVQGATTTFPRIISFGANTTIGSESVAVGPIPNCSFVTSATSCTTPVTMTAPSTPGGYSVKIAATGGTGGRDGLSPGNGVVVSFVVAAPPSEPEPIATSLDLALDNGCIVLHHGAVGFVATLTAAGSPLAGEQIDFTVDGEPVGSAWTDIDGQATLAFDSSALGVGDHTVGAEFEATTTHLGSLSTETLGVSYLFAGFQQPINADGSSRFGGRVVPVKVRVLDALGAPVGDAAAHVYFAVGTATVIGTDAEPVANTNGDSGNEMRYDPTAQQYVFNWDVRSLDNGTYWVRVDLAEGTCGEPHVVLLSLKRNGK